MTTRTRRTPEQLAAYHQRKANQARAKAAKQKKNEREMLERELGKVMLRAFGAGGEMNSETTGYHFSFLVSAFNRVIGDAERERLREMWIGQNLPLGPEPDGEQE